MPGRFGIGQDGTVLYAEVNPDYTQRPEPEDLLPALRASVAAGGLIAMARTILITGATKGIGRATADLPRRRRTSRGGDRARRFARLSPASLLS